MSLTKFTGFARLLSNASLRRAAFGGQSQRFISRRYDDSFFGVASSLIRNLENEFDQMRNQLARSSMFPPMQRFFELPSATALEARPTTHKDLITVDEHGNRKFELQVNLNGFQPEEISVETNGSLITVSAKKEQTSEDSYVLREFTQSYSLPDDLKLEDLKSKWTDTGLLSIEAPLPKLPEIQKQKQLKEKDIPIKHQQQQQIKKQ